MKRILIIGLHTGIGGVQTYLMNLYRNVDRNKIQFDFIVPGESAYFENEIKNLGGEIYYITPKKESLIKNIKELYKIMKENKNKYQFIYFNFSILYYIAHFIIAKYLKYPVIISHAHSARPKKQKKDLRYYLHIFNRKYIVKNSDYLFSASGTASEWVFGNTKKYNKKVVIIPNGIDTGLFNYDSQKRNDIRKELGISDDTVIMGHAGRLSPEKNQFFLIDIFKAFLKHQPNSKLLIAGDGVLKNQLRNKIIMENLESKIELLGARDDLSSILQSMDVFVLPSLYEGLGISLIEAQATGLPCFTSKNRVPNQVNITGNTYFIELKENSNEWAEIINTKLKDFYRMDKTQDIKESGYDIYTVAKNFQSFIFSI